MATAVVLGGGISGLSAAYYATKLQNRAFKKIILVEATSHLGGWIKSIRHDDGAVYELGPRSMRPGGDSGFNSLELVEHIGLSDQVINVTSEHTAAKSRYILLGGKLVMLPSARTLFRKQPPLKRSLLSLAFKEWRTKSIPLLDESIYDFVDRRFGPEAAKYLADPLCQGVWGGNASELSMRSCFPDAFNAEQEHGSMVRGMLKAEKKKVQIRSKLGHISHAQKWAMWSLKNGMQTLADRLAEVVGSSPGVSVLQNEPCTMIDFDNGIAKVKTTEKLIEADHVFAALPAKVLSSLLPDKHQVLKEALRRIESASVAIVNLEYKGNPLSIEGFGYLVPSSENARIMGVVFDSCAFPQMDRKEEQASRFTCMMGGAWFKEKFGDPDLVSKDDLLKTATESLQAHLGISQDPIRSFVTVNKECIPQYRIGHYSVLEDCVLHINEHELPLSLLGSSYNGVSVNDCIYNTRNEVISVGKGMAAREEKSTDVSFNM